MFKSPFDRMHYEWYLDWYLTDDSKFSDLSEEEQEALLNMVGFKLEQVKGKAKRFYVYDIQREQYMGDGWQYTNKNAIAVRGTTEALEYIEEPYITDFFKEDEDYIEQFYKNKKCLMNIQEEV